MTTSFMKLRAYMRVTAVIVPFIYLFAFVMFACGRFACGRFAVALLCYCICELLRSMFLSNKRNKLKEVVDRTGFAWELIAKLFIMFGIVALPVSDKIMDVVLNMDKVSLLDWRIVVGAILLALCSARKCLYFVTSVSDAEIISFYEK